MRIVLKKILIVLFTSALVKLSAQSMDGKQHCSVLKETEQQCGYYCYNVVKPLLQYLETARSKEQQYEEFLVKVPSLEMTIKHMESTIKDQKIQLEYLEKVRSKEQQYEEFLVKVPSLEMTIKHLESTIKDKKIQLEKQLELTEVYKEKSKNNEGLLKEKNKKILELETQILQYQRSETDSKQINFEEQKIYNEELLEEKNKKILELETQILQYQRSETDSKQLKIEEQKIYNEELLEGKNKKILELETQILQYQRSETDSKQINFEEQKIYNEELLEEKNKKILELETQILQYQRSEIDSKQLKIEEQKIYNEELLKEKNKKIVELEAQILQYQKSETDSKQLKIDEQNIVSNENMIMPLESPSNLNFHSTDKQNSIVVSTATSPSNENQYNVLISQIQDLEIDKSSISEYYFYKYLSEICIGKSTDVYMLKIPGNKHFAIPCDSTLAGSGWIVIQRRQDGTENFNRNWRDYQMGFGDLRGEFFTGLEKLHLITNSQPHELYIHLEDLNDNIRYAHYNNFVVGNETESYAIKSLGEYSGNADNALLSHKDIKFSTPDRSFDNNCAETYKSGWWFNDGCYHCNLNGPYISRNSPNSKAIEWRTWHFNPLKFVQMMIRPNHKK